MTRKMLGLPALVAVLLLTASGVTRAQEESGSTEIKPGFIRSFMPDFDISVGGFVRIENAVSTTDEGNPNNQRSNDFNERPQARQAFVPPGYVPAVLNGVGLCGVLGQLCNLPQAAVSSWTSLPFPTLLAADAASPGVRGTFNSNPSGQLTGQPFRRSDDIINFQILRAELETGIKFTQNLSLIARLRGIYDPTLFYKEFDANSTNNIITTGGGGIVGGEQRLYGGKPDYFNYIVEGGKKPNPLEWTGRDYQVYFPALILDYNRGPVNLRIGNQQIAWGQALFYRVFDVVDGLDLRRHLVLDYAQEEYADERVPALGIRTSWQVNEELLFDSFVQKFQPSIYPNPNTPYNVIPSQFTVHDLYVQGNYDDKVNFGLRFKGNYGQWGFQAAGVRRYNPDGVFRWTKSGVDRDLPCANTTDNTLACRVELTLQTYGQRSGALFANSAFEASPGGVYSAQEWFSYAAQARLNAVEGLNASITEFPATTQLYATPVNTVEEAYNELNTFFIASGGALRGHIAREYFKEDVISLGASYVVEGEPGGIFDQLIINLEHAYTHNRTFTAPSLSRNYVRTNTNVTALVMEKYYRFTQAFPATYFVYQFMYRDKDDLFGRLLDGYGGSETKAADGVSNAMYHVIAMQQPFPQDIFRAGFALLVDPRGSLLVQPGIRWKYNSALTFEAFYTHIEGSLGGANPNNTLLSTVGFADEATVRLTFQF